MLSVIVPSYSSSDTLAQCLNSIQAQKISIPFEIIVVDSSPDSKCDAIVATFHDVKFIKRETRTPAGLARNIGASFAAAASDLLFFVDSDIILAPSTLQKIWQRYTQGYEIFSVALELSRDKASWTQILEHLLYFHEFQSQRPSEKKRTYLPQHW